MNRKAASSKTSELLSHASLISEQLLLEEDKLKKALANNTGSEQLEIIQNKINILRRKKILFDQAAKMRQSKD